MHDLKDVRVISLPPATVAPVQYYYEEPEKAGNVVIDEFVLENYLGKVKHDAMEGCPEEQIDYLLNLNDTAFTEENIQLDLLVPIKIK